MSDIIRGTKETDVRDYFDDAALLFAPKISQNYCLLKRYIDITICLFASIICFPIILLIGFIIKSDTPGPVLFSQKRVGTKTEFINGKPKISNYHFNMYKFRTMYLDASERRHQDFIQAYISNDEAQMAELQVGEVNQSNRYKLVGDPRVTPVGKILRKTSLDELPQIFNVIKGDMSLVGPRPPIPYEVAKYKPWHKQRLLAKPGITGLPQATARSSIDFDGMVRMDIDYINRQSLWLDLKILLKTLLVVLFTKGAV